MGPLLYAVDDEQNDLDLMVRALRPAYLVRPFQDPRKALAAATKEPPDVILTAYRMPHYNGLSLLRELQRHGVRCIALLITSPGDVDAVHKADGARAFFRMISKPWIATELRRQVDLAVTLHQMQLRGRT